MRCDGLAAVAVVGTQETSGKERTRSHATDRQIRRRVRQDVLCMRLAACYNYGDTLYFCACPSHLDLELSEEAVHNDAVARVGGSEEHGLWKAAIGLSPLSASRRPATKDTRENRERTMEAREPTTPHWRFAGSPLKRNPVGTRRVSLVRRPPLSASRAGSNSRRVAERVEDPSDHPQGRASRGETRED